MAVNNPWHDLSYGANAPESVTAVIEIPKGSRTKYELDKESGMLILDRVLYSSVYYPANYGFIPRTYCDDKDPLDILVLCSQDIVPMCLVESRPIGVMHMVDGGEDDDKIIAVAKNDMAFSHINDVEDLGPHLMKEVCDFFKEYKRLENKSVEVSAPQGREAALQIIKESIELYNQNFAR